MNVRVHSMFGQALDQPEATRLIWLRAQCADDPSLLDAVSAMLSADTALGMLDGHVADWAEPLMTETPNSGDSAHSQRIGTQFGPYVIRQLLGRGGMGSVWLADRDDGAFVQQVAIKVMASALPSDEALQRFAQERQILVRLQHPNIARVLDGGSVEGAPWFAMDYVQGIALDAYAKQHALSIEQKLALFSKVVSAVQFAHQNLVVHRDLKPSNILVDAGGEPRLMDFGVAKLLGEVGEQTASRAPMSMAYAAPEQIAGGAITTATDIYGLGVVLYELLSGERPHKGRGNGNLALLQAITDTDPVPPSRAVGSETTRDARRLKGDLDTIVLKCLSRDPARRYASATALHVDIARFLAGMPIDARPDTAGYRLGKFVRRHRLGSALAAVAVSVLIGATVFSLKQMVRAEAAARQVAFERDAALAESRQQEALSQHFGAVLQRAVASGETVAVSQLSAWVADPLLLGGFGDKQMQRRIEFAISDFMIQNHDYAAAMVLLDRLLAQIPELGQHERLQLLSNLAIANIRTGQLDAASAYLDRAEGMLPTQDRSIEKAMLRNYRSQWLRLNGRVAEAIVAARESGDWAAATRDGTAFGRGSIVGGAANGLLQMGDLDGAVAQAETALAIWRDANLSRNANVPSIVAVAANARFLRGDISLALAQLEALSADDSVAEAIPPRAARNMTHAKALALLNRRAEALELAEKSVRAMCQAIGPDSLDCLSLRISQIDTARIAGDRKLASRLLVQVQAQLERKPVPALQASANRFGVALAAWSDPNPSAIDTLLEQLSAAAEQDAMARRNVVRNFLIMAEQLHADGHAAAAARCAEAAIDLASGLESNSGMDRSLLLLWQSRLNNEPVPAMAMSMLIQALKAEHPWVAAHRGP